MSVSTVRLAESYLNTQLTATGPAGHPQACGPFVTLSRQAGTGGLAMAEAVAARLRHGPTPAAWAVYSANIIKEMLRTHQLPAHFARFLPEDRLPQIEASIGEIVGLHPDLWGLVDKTNDALRNLAQAGGTILLGRGANFATAGLAHGLHVRLVAPEPMRTARTARLLSLTPEAAANHNEHVDAARRRYVRATFDADIAEPAAYDFVINLGRVRFDDAVEMIARAVPAVPVAAESGRAPAPAGEHA